MKNIFLACSFGALVVAWAWDAGVWAVYNPAYAEIALVASIELFLLWLAKEIIDNN